MYFIQLERVRMCFWAYFVKNQCDLVYQAQLGTVFMPEPDNKRNSLSAADHGFAHEFIFERKMPTSVYNIIRATFI